MNFLLYQSYNNTYEEIMGIQKYIDEYNTLKYVALLTIFFVFISSLENLKKALPSFGVLFDTLNEAKYDLLNYIFVKKNLVILF